MLPAPPAPEPRASRSSGCGPGTPTSLPSGLSPFRTRREEHAELSQSETLLQDRERKLRHGSSLFIDVLRFLAGHLAAKRCAPGTVISDNTAVDARNGCSRRRRPDIAGTVDLPSGSARTYFNRLPAG